MVGAVFGEWGNVGDWWLDGCWERTLVVGGVLVLCVLVSGGFAGAGEFLLWLSRSGVWLVGVLVVFGRGDNGGEFWRGAFWTWRVKFSDWLLFGGW